ncbi:type II secretion system protein [Luteitalea sp.]|uniref:type II secretion system protein n=1 Tax=Luteitalea sp. TaxID=2004800 RepID=UPI0025C68A12|nr:type II secretion system protein [Luteitalea sp.]
MPTRQWFGGRRQRVVVGFQARLAATQLAWTIGLLLLLVALLVAPVIQDLESMDERTRVDAATVLLSLHDRIWSAVIAVTAALAAVTLTLTHRVAGPLYRFRHVFEAVSIGQLWVHAGIRSTDYPKEESAALEHMLGTLRTQIGRARLATQEARAATDPVAAMDAIRRADEALAFFTLDRRQAAPPPTAAPPDDAPAGEPEGGTRPSSESGMTLVELIVVVALIGVIAAIGVPQYTAAVEAARVTRAIGDVRSIDREIQAYRALNGCFPGSLADIDQQRKDPWGNPYVYNVLSPNGGGGGGGGGAQGGGGNGGGGGKGNGGGGNGGGGGGGGGAPAPDPGCQACNGVCVGTGGARKDRNLVPINSDYDFFSKGRDGQSVGPLSGGPSQDDIVRGSDGAFFGLGRDY